MVDAKCLDGNRSIIYYGPTNTGDAEIEELYGPGPPQCADSLIFELRMSDAYVPGTSFSQYSHEPANAFVESLYVRDGVHEIFESFDRQEMEGPYSGYVHGWMPERAGDGYLDVRWAEGYFFTAGSNDWFMAVEFGAMGDAVCGLGSVEGPSVSGGICRDWEHYFSSGTFNLFRRVPESGTLALLGFGLLGLGISRRKA